MGSLYESEGPKIGDIDRRFDIFRSLPCLPLIGVTDIVSCVGRRSCAAVIDAAGSGIWLLLIAGGRGLGAGCALGSRTSVPSTADEAGTLLAAGRSSGGEPGIGAGVLTVGVLGGLASEVLWNLCPAIAGDRFDGTVLLRPNPPALPALPPNADGEAGVPGIDTFGLLRSLEFRDDKDALRRTPPVLRRLSAPMVVALDALTDGGPLLTSSFVFSSMAVPVMPIKKLSWFSMRKIRTSWLSRYSFGAIS